MGDLRVKQVTARPRAMKASASNHWGTVNADGSGRIGPELKARRKVPFSAEHLKLAAQLGVTPKALQREISRLRRERETLANTNK